MKNTLIIDSENDQLLSSINDGTNRLFINGNEIDSSEWVGTGYYSTVINGKTIAIKQVDSLEDNIILIKDSDYRYQLKRISLQLYPSGKDGKDGKDGITPQLMINADGHLIAIYE